MDQNPIIEWLKTDEQLCNIINQIESTGKSYEEQALDAFHTLSEHYDLPKYPDSFTDEQYDRYDQMDVAYPRCVFEEATILTYLNPDGDPRGIVMAALYAAKNGIFMDLKECAQKHFGSKKAIPQKYFVCFIGDGFAGRLHFLAEGESWIELGARSMLQVIRQ